MKNPVEIIHEYANNAVVSRHRTVETAQKKLDRMARAFRRAYPSTFPTRAIFPYAIKENS